MTAPEESPIPVLLMVRTLTAGGTERQMTELARSLDRAAFQPHVACFVESGFRAEELRACGVPIVEIQLRSFMKPHALAAARRLGRYIRQHGIRLVHTFDYPANIFGVPAARFAGVRVLSSQRGYRTMYAAKYRRLLRLSDKLAHGIVVNCEAMRRHLVEDYAVPERKIHLCYNGIDTSVFYPGGGRGTAARRDSETAGTVSVLRPEKGVRLLVEAFAQVHAARPDSRLLVVGSGPCSGEIIGEAESSGVREACTFEPATSEVARRLRELDIFVLPSYSEALSNSLMEAMACGCACIASRVGGNPELIEDGVNGVLFEKGNARDLAEKLRLLFDRPDLRACYGTRAAARIREQFPLARSAARMEEIYRRFLTAE